MKHLGEKALVFFPSKTDLISITENGEVTEELLSERLEAINNKIEKQNLLKNIAQYTKENPLVYTFNKNFSTTCTLEAGKWYSFSFDYIGDLSRNTEIGFTNIDDSDNADIIDIINQSTIYDFYFQAKFSAEYNFYWNMLDENNENTKIYNLKVVEGYSPEMVKTVEEIKKLDKSKLMNLAPNDRYKLTHLPYNTAEIYDRIANEKWEDLPIGGYFTVTVNSSVGGSELVDFVIAHINPYTNRGSTPLTRPHVAIVPMNAFKTLAPMNVPSVELKNASDNIKSENHYIGTVSDIPSGSSDLNRTTGIGTSSGSTIITNKYDVSINDIIYVESSSLVKVGYYRVTGTGGVGKIIFDKGTMPITPNVEYLGTTYTIGKGDTTAGGYAGSDMYTKTLPSYEAALKTVFGTHMLKFTTLLTTSVNMNVNSGAYPNQKGAANGWAWKDCYLRLMNEIQVYGTKVWSSSGYDIGEENFQLALFQHDPINMIAKQGNSGGRTNYWLSAVASGSSFCYCDGNVNSNCSYASNSLGVRPYFLLG